MFVNWQIIDGADESYLRFLSLFPMLLQIDYTSDQAFPSRMAEIVSRGIVCQYRTALA